VTLPCQDLVPVQRALATALWNSMTVSDRLGVESDLCKNRTSVRQPLKVADNKPVD